jgi:hypothetical protein
LDPSRGATNVLDFNGSYECTDVCSIPIFNMVMYFFRASKVCYIQVPVSNYSGHRTYGTYYLCMACFVTAFISMESGNNWIQIYGYRINEVILIQIWLQQYLPRDDVLPYLLLIVDLRGRKYIYRRRTLRLSAWLLFASILLEPSLLLHQ